MVRKGLLKFSSAELQSIQASGEENVGGIVALGKALILLQRIGLDVIQAEEQTLIVRALRGLAQIPGLTMYGIKDLNSPKFAQKGGVIVFSLDGMLAPQVAEELAERGAIGVRAGCHCAHLLVKHLLHISPSLQLFQGLIVSLFPRIELPGITRVSLGIENSAEEIDALVHVLDTIARQPRAGMGNPFSSAQTDTRRQMEAFAKAVAKRVYA